MLLHLPRVEGQSHGRHEQAGLAVEVVVDEGGVDAGLPGDAAQAGAVVALVREDALGRLDDLTPGVRVPRPTSDGAHRRSAANWRVSRYSPAENSVLKLISDES